MAEAVQENFDDVIPFEPEYEDVKRDRNKIWFKYEEKIEKLVKWLSWYKNFSKDELTQQSYLYFVTLCEAYDPYYMGHFFPFDRYLFKNLIIKLRAYIQRYYFKGKREKPSEYCEFLLQNETVNNIKDSESKLYNEYVYSLLSERQSEIVRLTLNGYKQQEIGKKLNISQSRVSVIKKKALEVLYRILDETHTEEEKNEMRINDLKKYIYDK
jgi:RNA polymerase sigma factor (sigma-70 family)